MKLSDFFGPRWKHSNATVRLKAVRELEPNDFKTLEEVAGHDPDSAVRLAALEKIGDTATLERLAVLEQPVEVLSVIRQRLNEIFKVSAMGAPDLTHAQPALMRIASDEFLATVAVEAPQIDVRLGAVRLIHQPAVLCQVAEAHCGKDVGVAVISKLDDAECLRRLSKSGSNKHTRRAASEKLAEMESVDSAPSARELREDELKTLVANAKQWANSWNWEYVAERFDEALTRWGQLDPQGKQPDFEVLQSACMRFQKRRREFEAKQAAEAAALAMRDAALAERRALAAALEELATPPAMAKTTAGADAAVAEAVDEAETPAVATPVALDEAALAAEAEATSEALAELDRLDAAWKALTPLDESDEADLLAANFATMLRESRRRWTHRAADREALATLAELATEAEQLAATESPNLKALNALQSRAKGLRLHAADPAPYQARIAAAVEQTRAQAQAATAAHREAVRADWQALLAALQQALQDPTSGESADVVKDAQKRAKALPHDNDPELRAMQDQVFGLADKFFEERRLQYEQREVERWANATAKEVLCAEAEALDAVEDIHQVARDVRELQSRWKEIGQVPREQMETLWQRFKTACDRNYQRAQVAFREEDENRQVNLAARLALIERVESLMNSTDWQPAAEEIKTAQSEWKALGHVPRDEDQPTWERFHAAANTFFERRRAHYEELDAQRATNGERKTALVEEAETVASSTDWADAETLRRLQADWKRIGAATREQEDALWERFRAACDGFFSRFDDARPANTERKQALVGELEALLASVGEAGPNRETAQAVMDLQRQWRDVGPADKEQEPPLWDRFSTLCDEFFGARREQIEVVHAERVENLKRKQELAEAAEALAGSSDWRSTADALKALQQQWKETGPAPRREEDAVWQRFQAACNGFFEARRKTFNEQDNRLTVNLQAKQDLCRQLEVLVGLASPEPEAKPEPPKPAKPAKKMDLATELTLALQANFVTSESRTTRPPASKDEEVRRIQARWKDIGPVPREQDRPLWERYRAALDRFYGNDRPAPKAPTKLTPKPAAAAEPETTPAAEASAEPVAAASAPAEATAPVTEEAVPVPVPEPEPIKDQRPPAPAQTPAAQAEPAPAPEPEREYPETD